MFMALVLGRCVWLVFGPLGKGSVQHVWAGPQRIIVGNSEEREEGDGFRQVGKIEK